MFIVLINYLHIWFAGNTPNTEKKKEGNGSDITDLGKKEKTGTENKGKSTGKGDSKGDGGAGKKEESKDGKGKNRCLHLNESKFLLSLLIGNQLMDSIVLNVDAGSSILLGRGGFGFSGPSTKLVGMVPPKLPSVLYQCKFSYKHSIHHAPIDKAPASNRVKTMLLFTTFQFKIELFIYQVKLTKELVGKVEENLETRYG